MLSLKSDGTDSLLVVADRLAHCVMLFGALVIGLAKDFTWRVMSRLVPSCRSLLTPVEANESARINDGRCDRVVIWFGALNEHLNKGGAHRQLLSVPTRHGLRQLDLGGVAIQTAFASASMVARLLLRY
jgi:hypothetical protein